MKSNKINFFSRIVLFCWSTQVTKCDVLKKTCQHERININNDRKLYRKIQGWGRVEIEDITQACFLV